MTVHGDGTDGLEAQDEILQVMFWLRGEGLAEDVSIADLARFIGSGDSGLEQGLQRLTRLGLVRGAGADMIRYALTPEGVREGGRRFADEFKDLTKPGHGECGDPECDCRQSGNPADCRHHA
ncbi:MAG: hypothetical protein M3541_04640 [Acidobacteriota bacterium]|jgi:hypothetical protein|nr:hypothetical protein [Acidobacteriota bacterium]MDQ3418056.1 hypothetical protein [Acidobacteriota bacterium]